jgi:peptide subunit release factor 1 (eRF1)
VRCPSCGLLASEGAVCPRCGSGMEPVIDIVDTAVATALRRRTTVEVVARDGDVVGALLRY